MFAHNTNQNSIEKGICLKCPLSISNKYFYGTFDTLHLEDKLYMDLPKPIVIFKVVVCLYFSLNTLSVQAQSKNSSEMVAEGSAKIKIRPDVAIFTLTVEKNDTIEKNVLKKLNEEIDNLVKSLYKIGFVNTSIKIADYNIESSTDYDNKIKRYTARNSLKLEFVINTKIIDALYKEIETAGLSDLDVSFETKISDSLEKATRLLLVRQAIQDAKVNAENIAMALNVKIIKVKQVLKYREGGLSSPAEIKQILFAPAIIKEDAAISSETGFQEFEMEDIELEEKITLVYEITN